MKEDLITFKTATLAKEKGFDVPCNHYVYTPESIKLVNKNRERLTGNKDTFKAEHIFKQTNKYSKGRIIDRNTYDTTISIPTQALLKKWLWERFKIFVDVGPFHLFKGFGVEIYQPTKENPTGYLPIEGLKGETPQEALEVGLQEALKLIKV